MRLERPPSQPGSVTVYERKDVGWVSVDTLFSESNSEREFGRHVALDGDLVAVSFEMDAPVSADRVDGVVTFTATPTGWSRRFIPEPDGADGFGDALAIGGTHILVGAPFADAGPQPNAGASPTGLSGYALVFDRESGDQPTARLALGPRRTEQRFGQSIDLDGPRIAIAAPGAGAVYIYKTSAASGGHPQLLEEARVAPAGRERQQMPLDLDGTRLLVGDTESRRAYVYEFDGAAWTQTQFFVGREDFASSVSLDGDQLLIGTREANGGVAVLYRHDGSQWSWESDFRVSLGGHFGFVGIAVALDGNRALVATRRATGEYTGVLVFEYDGLRWHQTRTLSSPVDGQFGRALALEGGRALVSNPDLSGTETARAVSVYSGVSLVETDALSGPPGDPRFGASLALDGDRAVVGAPSPNADESGIAYGFEFDGLVWSPPLPIRPPEGVLVPEFGSAVAVAGRRYLVGAPLEALDDPNAGAVYAYETASVVASDGTPESPGELLSVPRPNPALNESRITLTVPSPSAASVSLHDTLGRTILRLVDGPVSDSVTVAIDVSGLAPGVYVVRAVHEGTVETRLLTVVR